MSVPRLPNTYLIFCHWNIGQETVYQGFFVVVFSSWITCQIKETIKANDDYRPQVTAAQRMWNVWAGWSLSEAK